LGCQKSEFVEILDNTGILGLVISFLRISSLYYPEFNEVNDYEKKIYNKLNNSNIEFHTSDLGDLETEYYILRSNFKIMEKKLDPMINKKVFEFFSRFSTELDKLGSIQSIIQFYQYSIQKLTKELDQFSTELCSIRNLLNFFK
jgi:hypothetical protein